MKWRKTALVEREGPWSLTTPVEGVVPYTQAHGESKKTGRCNYCNGLLHDHGWCTTLEGGHVTCPGDYILIGTKGERWPIKPDIFASTYTENDVEDDTGAGLIAAERKRQIDQEGWTAAHDAQHTDGSLAHAAICYLANGNNDTRISCAVQVQDKLLTLRAIPSWPASWAQTWDRRGSIGYRRSLVVAGALTAAEIDRVARQDRRRDVD